MWGQNIVTQVKLLLSAMLDCSLVDKMHNSHMLKKILAIKRWTAYLPYLVKTKKMEMFPKFNEKVLLSVCPCCSH